MRPLKQVDKWSVVRLSALARRGELGAVERGELEARLGNSVVDRWLHDTGQSFDQQQIELAGDADLLRRLTEQAIEHAMHQPARGFFAGGRVGRAKRPALMFVLALGFGLSSAAAATFYSSWRKSEAARSNMVPIEVVSSIAARSNARPTAVGPSESATASLSAPAPAAADVAFTPSSAVANASLRLSLTATTEPVRDPQARASVPLLPRESTVRKTASTAVLSQSSEVVEASAQPLPLERDLANRARSLGPAPLFARANAARRARDVARAIDDYRDLQRLFPTSPEAKLAHVSLGHVYLAERNPEAALGSFRTYLTGQPQEPLREEALYGAATALWQLGRFAEEQATLRELVERYPHSVYALKARERLGREP
jgi:TolA-binding protein